MYQVTLSFDDVGLRSSASAVYSKDILLRSSVGSDDESVIHRIFAESARILLTVFATGEPSPWNDLI